MGFVGHNRLSDLLGEVSVCRVAFLLIGSRFRVIAIALVSLGVIWLWRVWILSEGGSCTRED
jgi:hypothetical protein